MLNLQPVAEIWPAEPSHLTHGAPMGKKTWWWQSRGNSYGHPSPCQIPKPQVVSCSWATHLLPPQLGQGRTRPFPIAQLGLNHVPSPVWGQVKPYSSPHGAGQVKPPSPAGLGWGQVAPCHPLCGQIEPTPPVLDARLGPLARSGPWIDRALFIQPAGQQG